MSKTFNGYNKKDTSGRNMLRIEKRERILGLAIAAGHIKPSDKFPKATEMEILSSHHDLLEWEINLVEKTGWLKTEKLYNGGLFVGVKFRDNIKLRIYRKWLYLNGDKTFKHVLKYMYSPLFPALLLMNRGIKTTTENIALGFSIQNSSIDLLRIWFKDILNIDANTHSNSCEQSLCFASDATNQLLFITEPIIKQIPSMYEKFYR